MPEVPLPATALYAGLNALIWGTIAIAALACLWLAVAA